jgi:uncharacterized FlgJ-related protein
MMSFMTKVSIVFKTLMFVFVLSACTAVVYAYHVQGEKQLETLESFEVQKPDFEHSSNQTFLDSVNMCVDYIYHTTTDVIPVNRELLLAQAALESGWGTSRFALEGKNLFGIRTYDLREPHMLPWKDKPKKWGVKVFFHECDSVQNYMDILNNGSAFEEYRILKHEGENDPFILITTLGAYASDANYFVKVKSIIKKIRSEYKLNYIK